MRTLARLCVLAAAILAMHAATVRAEIYQIDPVHSSVTFQIRHFFSKVSGRFNQFNGVIEFDPARPETSFVDAAIRVDTIDTGNQKRDTDLKSPKFFDAETFPTITFASKKIEPNGAKSARVTGELIIHGVKQPATLDVTFLGKGKGMKGESKIGFTAKTKIDRKNFGLKWNQVVEGTSVLGDEVEIEINVEANSVSSAASKS
jgi:polyisoprenoid-binding protein YceI